MSTTPPRNVIYCNERTFLQDIVGLPYTDVILNFLAPAPDGSGNLKGPYLEPGDVQALQNAGMNVLVSLGGDPGTFPSEAWKQYAQNVNGLVQKVTAYVTENGLNGVDIDYEDDNGLYGDNSGKMRTYDGITFLIDLTNGLAQSLPPGQNIITHAPAPGYFNPDDIYSNAYTQIFAAAGDNIDWFNCQFYDNSPYDDSASSKVTWYGTIAGTTGAPKLLVGAPVAAAAAGTGYLSVGDFTSGVIAPLRQQFPGTFGGVTGWAFVYDQGSDWPDGIAQALHQQHVFYRGADNNVHQAYWDPATQLGASQWTSDGQVAPGLATLLSG
jgi:chitinase